MKKTISITINKIVFQIDEDAYNKLDEYLESIKKHYSDLKEGAEILADIESGIAEKFSDKISNKKQNVDLKDVDGVIKVMGTVEEIEWSESSVRDFDGEKEEFDGVKDEDKPAFAKASARQGKKLYRDPDDQILAGVCSGLAAYFGVDPVFVRLLFIVLLLFRGFGLLLYLILWVVMPQAKTGAQKLQMCGKPVNIKKIEQVVKEKSKMVKEEGRQALNRLRRKNPQAGGDQTFDRLQVEHERVLYKILNFPIRILEVIFSFLKKFLRILGPGLSIFIGVILIVCIVVLMLALTTAAGVLVFNINSEYIVSDIPLQEILQSMFYYVGVVSAYLVSLVPLIFILILGITMTTRKNAFRALTSGILIAMWMLAIVGCVVAAGYLVPSVNNKLAEIQKNESVSRDYEYSDFNKLYIGAHMDVDVKQGEEFLISMTGRAQDLDRLTFKIEDGQLQIVQQQRREEGKICLLCFNKEIKAEIIMPELDSFVGTRNSHASIFGFGDDMYVSLGESSRAEINLEGQSLECKLAGTSSRLELVGRVKNLKCEIFGNASLVTDRGFEAGRVDLDLDVFAKAELEGKAKILKVEVNGRAGLYAFDLKTDRIVVNACKYSKAEVWPIFGLSAVANDKS